MFRKFRQQLWKTMYNYFIALKTYLQKSVREDSET